MEQREMVQIPTLPERIGQIVGVDFIGPLQCEQGSKYLLTAIDHFSKYAEAYVVRRCSTKTMAEFLATRYIPTHGVPETLVSDRGPTFISDLIRKLRLDWGIVQVLTSAYHPRSKDVSERFHETFANIVAEICRETQKWETAIAVALAAYRATPLSSMGHTPNSLTFGRELCRPNVADLCQGCTCTEEELHLSRSIQKIHQIVGAQLKKAPAWRADSINDCSTSMAPLSGPVPTSRRRVVQSVCSAPVGPALPIPILPERLGQIIEVDFLGPFECQQGSKYLLTAVDHFSKYPEAYVVQECSVNTVAEYLATRYIPMHGVPEILVSDRGTTFTRDLVQMLHREWGIVQVMASAHQSNDVQERFHKTFSNVVAEISRETRNWETIIPIAMAAYRSTRLPSTGQTPYFLTFGRELCNVDNSCLGRKEEEMLLSRHIQKVCNVDNSCLGRKEEEMLLSRHIQKVHQIVGAQLKEAAARRANAINERRNLSRYKSGQKVYVKMMIPVAEACKKYWNPWIGPSVILQRIKLVAYKLRYPAGEIQEVHVSRLKPAYHDEEVVQWTASIDESNLTSSATDCNVSTDRNTSTAPPNRPNSTRLSDPPIESEEWMEENRWVLTPELLYQLGRILGQDNRPTLLGRGGSTRRTARKEEPNTSPREFLTPSSSSGWCHEKNATEPRKTPNTPIERKRPSDCCATDGRHSSRPQKKKLKECLKKILEK